MVLAMMALVVLPVTPEKNMFQIPVPLPSAPSPLLPSTVQEAAWATFQKTRVVSPFFTSEGATCRWPVALNVLPETLVASNSSNPMGGLMH